MKSNATGDDCLFADSALPGSVDSASLVEAEEP
jgi:hypothetical protein